MKLPKVKIANLGLKVALADSRVYGARFPQIWFRVIQRDTAFADVLAEHCKHIIFPPDLDGAVIIQNAETARPFHWKSAGTRHRIVPW